MHEKYTIYFDYKENSLLFLLINYTFVFLCEKKKIKKYHIKYKKYSAPIAIYANV